MTGFKIGDFVRVKEDAPGFQPNYEGKIGRIVAKAKNDEGEDRLLVIFPGEGVRLPFGEWELIYVTLPLIANG